jgi:MFS family permease
MTLRRTGPSSEPADERSGPAAERAGERAGAVTVDGGPTDRVLSAPFWILVVSSTFFFTAQGMLFPVLPRYVEDELGGGGLAVGITVGSFAIGAMVARPFGGREADRIGRRLVAVAGSLLWAGMVALYPVAGAAGGTPALVGVRAVGGLGGGALFVALATIATDLAPPARRVQSFGLFSASTLLGFAIGPALGELILAGHRFGLTFGICAVLATAPALAMAIVADTRPAYAHAAAGAPRPPGLAALLHPAARRVGLALLLGSLGFITFTAFVPLHADDVGLEDAAIPLTLNAVVNLAGRVVGAHVADRIGRKVLTAGSLTLVASAAVTLALWAAPAGILVAAVLNGLGNAYMFAGFLAMTVEVVPDEERASAIGSLTVFSDLAHSGGGAVLGLAASVAGYRWAFAVAALCAATSLVLVSRWEVAPAR